MLDPFVQLLQHCWGRARSLRMVYKDLWAVSFPRCTAGPNIVGSCCILLHTTANMHATTPNIVGCNNVGSCCVRLHAALYCVSHPVIHNSLWHRRLDCTCRGSQLFSFLEVLGNNSCNPFQRWFSWARTMVCPEAFVLHKISSRSVFDAVWWSILIYGNTRELHVSVISNLQDMYKTWSVAFRIEKRQIARHTEQGLLYTASLGSKAFYENWVISWISVLRCSVSLQGAWTLMSENKQA